MNYNLSFPSTDQWFNSERLSKRLGVCSSGRKAFCSSERLPHDLFGVREASAVLEGGASGCQDGSFHLNPDCDGLGTPQRNSLLLWAMERIQQEAAAGRVRQSKL